MEKVPIGDAAKQFRVRRRRKDRHGRAQNVPITYPMLPAWRTRREKFDELVLEVVGEFAARFPEVYSIEFGVEEVPPSSPAPWEDHDVTAARVFPRDRARGLRDRIVLYRRAILNRCAGGDCAELVYFLLAERISRVLCVDPEELLGWR